MNDSGEEKTMKSIWYFVGLVLLSIGILVFLTGVFIAVFDVKVSTSLARLHPDIWWGAVMVIAGLIFFIKNR